MRIERNEDKFQDREFIRMVSHNIRFYRLNHRNPKYLDKKLTQLVMSEEMQISRSLLSNIESKKVYVEFSMAIINRASKICNIPASWYLMSQPPKEFYEGSFIHKQK